MAVSLGGFDPAFDGSFGYEDLEFGSRLWRAGVRFVHATRAEVLHQENEAVPSDTKVSTAAANRRKLYERIPELRDARRWLSDQGLSQSVFDEPVGEQ